MSDTPLDLLVGQSYKAFELIQKFDVSDFHSTALFFRHKETGLEVLHLVNDETENLFSFTFRTPNDKANGAAHILEHSVLCGSEKFPLKDPFIRMSNQSVKTYLNAMTYPDRTVFPASSIVKSDYFNLFRVYADAVFFPRLDKEIFSQEAHRLEIDDNGKVSIQGVVYNEMKGAYSSFESVAADEAFRSILQGSVYAKDSGGDPLAIPTITHEELLAFHKKWYTPDNCLVFLYGNISTFEQLDFLQSEILDRLQKRCSVSVSEKSRSEKLHSFIKAVTPAKQRSPFTKYADGPSGEENEKKNTVLVNWLLDTVDSSEKAFAYLFLTGILLNHDGSPLQKALMESDLGEDVSPSTGIDGTLYHYTFSAGLRGVKKGDEEKVRDLIFETLTRLCENGIPKEDIDATMMTLEYSHREIKRSHGPYALRLMGNAGRSWVYGYDLSHSFRLRSDLEKVREKVYGEKGYLENLIRKSFLENPNYSLVIVQPGKKYTRDRDKAEQKLIKELMKHTDEKRIRSENEALHAFQGKAEDDSCLPHLFPRDFLKDRANLIDHINTEISSLKACDGRELPYFINREHTNGIIYADVGFPADVLNAEDYCLLPIFAECAADVGWKDLSWDKSASETALHTGGFTISLLSSESPETSAADEFARSHGFARRDWVVYRISMLEEEVGPALSILSDAITGTDFHDEKRLSDLITELKNDIESSVVPDGHDYVSMRTKRSQSHAKVVDEIWNGLTLLYTTRKAVSSAPAQTATSLRRIFAELKNGGSFIHVTADDDGIAAFEKELPAFIQKTGLVSLKESKKTPMASFLKLTELEGGQGDSSAQENEILTVSSQVGFASETIGASPYGKKEAAVEEVCAHWLSNTLLWERLRTMGGAYGAFCYCESLSASFVFASYRDPSPEKSCDVFDSCLKEGSLHDFSADEVDRAIIGSYSNFIQPKTPKSRGSTGLLRTLYAICDCDREEKVIQMLSAGADDIRRSFEKLSENARAQRCRSIICSESIKLTGKKVTLPL